MWSPDETGGLCTPFGFVMLLHRGYPSELLLILSTSYGTHRVEDISNAVRASMRLLHLRASGQLTEGQWCSLRSLKSHRDEYRTAPGSTWQGIEADCRLIRDGTGTDVDEDVLQNLICIVWPTSTMSLISFPERHTLSYEVPQCPNLCMLLVI